MGFASGLSAGMGLVTSMRNLYNESEQARLMSEEKKKAALGDYQQHTAEYGKGLEAKAAETDQYGRPLWDISIQPGSVNYDVRPISYDDSAATAAQPSYGFAPEGLSKYASVAPSQPFTPSPVATYPVPSEEQPDVGGVQGGRTPGMMPIPSVPQTGLQPGADMLGPEYKSATAASPAEQGLGRTLGEALPYEKMKTTYMGKQYDGPLTPEMKRAAQHEAYADVYEQLGKPEQAMQLRAAAMQLRKGSLELEGLETAAEKSKSLRDVQKQLAEDWKMRLGDRAPTNDDFVAHGTRTAALLMAGGHVDEANAAISKATELNLNRMKQESTERALEIPKAIAALNTGNVGAALQVYDRFIHDGARTTGAVVNKDGSITVSRTLLDGSKLPDHTFSSARELGAYMNELRDPGAAEQFSVNMFKQNIMSAELKVKEREADARGLSAKASMVNATRPSTGSLYPVTTKDGKLGFVDAATGRVIEAPEGVSLTNKSGKQVSKLTPEQDTRYKALVRSDKWQRAKTDADKIRLLEAEGIPADAVGFAAEDAGVSDW